MSDRSRERGMALLVVLVVVALLTTALVELAFSTLVDMRLTETFRDGTRAYYLAKGGINAGRMLLQEDHNRYDGLDEPWSRGVVNYPVGDGTVTVQISDLDGKLAINSLVTGDTPQAVIVDRFYRFFSAVQLDATADPAELTAALIDWLDTGDEPYAEILTDGANLPVAGAEQSYYGSRAEPYSCKNGPLETLDELGLIKGFTPEVVQRVRGHLAVSDSRALNINTASVEVLMALDLALDRTTAEEIVAYRRETPIVEVAQLEDLLAPEAYSVLKTLANLQQLATTSTLYRIESEGWVNDGRRRLAARVDKRGNQLQFFKVE